MFDAGMRPTLAQRLVPIVLSGCGSLTKHVVTVWPLTSTLACLVTKQCLMVFGRQTFSVFSVHNGNKGDKMQPSSSNIIKHERLCLTTFPNIEKRVENTTHSGIFLRNSNCWDR